jgi:hypothetical protein
MTGRCPHAQIASVQSSSMEPGGRYCTGRGSYLDSVSRLRRPSPESPDSLGGSNGKSLPVLAPLYIELVSRRTGDTRIGREPAARRARVGHDKKREQLVVLQRARTPRATQRGTAIALRRLFIRCGTSAAMKGNTMATERSAVPVEMLGKKPVGIQIQFRDAVRSSRARCQPRPCW